MGNSNTQEANTQEAIRKKTISEFVEASGADAIPRMHRMLYVDRSITDINIKDSTWSDHTALHYQSQYGTTGSVAWLLMQDPPAGVNERNSYQKTPLMDAACSGEDPEGKVRLLLDHGADRDIKNQWGNTALDYARSTNKPAVIDMLENYRPDVSR